MTEYLAKAQKANAAPVVKITSDEAAKTICSSSASAASVGFDELEAARFGLKLGQTVAVTPTDTGAWSSFI